MMTFNDEEMYHGYYWRGEPVYPVPLP